MKLNKHTKILLSLMIALHPTWAGASLTDINTDTTTALSPDSGKGNGGLGGYNFIADNVNLTVTDGYIIGRTPNDATGISVDSIIANNDNGLIFAGNGTVQGAIGTTNPIGQIDLIGAQSTVFMQGNVFGNVSVSNGSTIVFADNLQASTNLTINDNSVLQINNNSSLAVNNDFTLGAGSTLALSLSGDLSNYPSVTANGSASIDPNSLVYIIEQPTFQAGMTQSLPIITGGAGSTINEIDVISDSLLFDYATAVDPLTGQLNLLITAEPLSSYAEYYDNSTVVQALDVLSKTPGISGSLLAILNALGNCSDVDSLVFALSTLVPFDDGALEYELLEAHDYKMDIIDQRLLSAANHKDKSHHLSGYSAGDGARVTAKKRPTTKLFYENAAYQNNVWIQGVTLNAQKKDVDGIKGFKDNLYGIITGLDRRVTEDWLLGLGLSVSRSRIVHHVTLGSLSHIQDYEGYLYSLYSLNKTFFVNGTIGASRDVINDIRHVIVENVFLSPTAHHYATTIFGRSGIGFHLGKIVQVGGIASVNGTLSWRNAYHEQGAGNAGHFVAAKKLDTLNGTLLGWINYQFETDNYDITPRFIAQAGHNFVEAPVQLTSEFIGGGPVIVTVGPSNPSDRYSVGPQLMISAKNSGWVLSSSYLYTMRQHYNSNTGTLNVRYRF